MSHAADGDTSRPTPARERWKAEHQEERKLRRLQTMLQLVVATIRQDRSITVEQAAQLAADARSTALRLFPEKELAFNLLCRPRIQRAMHERFRLQ